MRRREKTGPERSATRRHAAGTVALLLTALVGCSRESTAPVPVATSRAEATAGQVQEFCGACHATPPPETFPRSVWRRQVEQGYSFFEIPSRRNFELARRVKPPPREAVVAYYEGRAPEALPPATPEAAPGPLPVRLERADFTPPGQRPSPAVSNVNLVHLFDDHRLDLLVCDMRSGHVLAMQPYLDPPVWRLLGTVPNPAHAEVVDLDGDGIKDVLVANLGVFQPSNDRVGSVVWLKGAADGTFTPITLLEGVGRVADVQAADFDGDGDLDLVVAVFGWHDSGGIFYLENRTTDWAHPVFVPHRLDDREGSIHVPVADLDGDGRPDFVALISQEHETVVAFLNEGNGRFRKETIYTAPHPAFGSTGIQLVDLDGDGRLDVLYTNGDVLDQPYLLKPYHGIHWLRNRGTFPFEHHQLAAMYGVHRAVAADLDGDGRLDVVAVSFLPAEVFPERRERRLASILLLEQTSPGRFVRHTLESVTCDHATCVVGAWDGDGVPHLATGNFCLSENHAIPHSVTLWKNRGFRKRGH